MDKTWRPTTGGLLCIIAGAIYVIAGLAAIVGILAAGMLELALAETAWLSLIGVPFVILGIISIVGGVYALKRRLWGLALAGSICTIIAGNLIYGTLAVIFVTLGKGEFE